MPHYFLLQSELQTWIVPAAGAIGTLLVAAIPATIVWLSMKGKTGAETIKILTEIVHNQALQIKSTVDEQTLSIATISRGEHEKLVFEKETLEAKRQASEANQRERDCAARYENCIEEYKADAQMIIEKVEKLGYMALGELTLQDNYAIEWIKTMKEIASRMKDRKGADLYPANFRYAIAIKPPTKWERLRAWVNG